MHSVSMFMRIGVGTRVACANECVGDKNCVSDVCIIILIVHMDISVSG